MVEVGDAASDTPRMLALINNLRGEITMLKAQLEERTREAEEARRRCAEYEADQAEQEKAARELRNALADYLSSRPAETPRLTEPRPQNSWESLETRVMGLEVTQVDPETPRSSLRKSPSIWRSGYTPRRLTASSRTSGRSPVLSKDPLGRISEMVAQVARERYNKNVESDESTVSASPRVPSRLAPISVHEGNDMPTSTKRSPLSALNSNTLPSPKKSAVERGSSPVPTPTPTIPPLSPLSSIGSFSFPRPAPNPAPVPDAFPQCMRTNALAKESPCSQSTAGPTPNLVRSHDNPLSLQRPPASDPPLTSDADSSGASTSRSSAAGAKSPGAESIRSSGSVIPALHGPEAESSAASASPPASIAPSSGEGGSRAAHRMSMPSKILRKPRDQPLPFGRHKGYIVRSTASRGAEDSGKRSRASLGHSSK